MKILTKKRLNYLLYIVIVVVVILAAFNTYLTYYIHKQIAQVVSNPGRWPDGAYIYDDAIGFDFAPNVSGWIDDRSYYVKSHQFGYRIGQEESADAWQPGGVLSLGCSFTYGDEVESEQTFTQVLADSLGIPAYNYGICSFSYTHALQKAQELKDEGILDQLQPKYVVLGCWNGLPDRSRAPFPPLASKTLPLPAAYITKEGGEVKIREPLKIQHIFGMVEMYREEGTDMSFKKFIRIFTAVPKYVYLYVKNNRMARQWRSRTFKNDVSDYEVYEFYYSRIKKIFSAYNSQIIVLYMPSSREEEPGNDLIRVLANHPDIIFVDGFKAIKKYGVPNREYQGRHPQPAAHKAYAWEILESIPD
jgi:hypothetical protein